MTELSEKKYIKYMKWHFHRSEKYTYIRTINTQSRRQSSSHLLLQRVINNKNNQQQF